MGRIRQSGIKKVAKKVFAEHPDKFGKDFQKNKEQLKEMKLLESKLIRNKVAGYVVRVAKNKKF